MSFRRFASTCAFIVGAGGIAYSIAYAVLLATSPKAAEILTSPFLLLGGLLSAAVLTGLYFALRPAETEFALWTLALGVIAALGSAVHGATDLANYIKPPNLNVGVPNAVDPRGVLTFGLTAVVVALLAWMMRRSVGFPSRLPILGFVLAAFLIVIYVARLTIFDPTNPLLLAAALVTGFVLSPAWNIWIGIVLRSAALSATEHSESGH